MVSSEEMEVRAESETEKEEKSETESETESGTEKKMKKKRKRKGGNSSGVVKWERFLRRMMIRVLLVEADDSTRQIIAALLRKCSYRGLYSVSLSLYICVCLFTFFALLAWFCWIFCFICRIVNWVFVGFGFCGKKF